MKRRLKDSFHIYALVTIIFWALSYVFTRLAVPYFSPLALGFLRYAAASVFLLIIIVKKRIKFPLKKDLPFFIAAGATGFFLYMITFNKGLETVTSSMGSLIIATAPILSAILARIFFKERIEAYRWLAIGVEFLGVVVLVFFEPLKALLLYPGGGFGAEAGPERVFSVNSGTLWMLAAALSISGYNVLQRKLTKTYPAFEASTVSIFMGTVMLAIFFPGAVKQAAVAPPRALGYVLFLGIFCSVVAYVAWSIAFARAEKTSSVSNYMFVTPFLAGIFGFLIAGEKPGLSTLLGGIIILSGMALFNFGSSFFGRPRSGI